VTIINRRIGIDFGTSTTIVCYIDVDAETGTVSPMKFVNLEPSGDRDRRFLASVIYDPPEGGQPLIGSRASDRFRKDKVKDGKRGKFAALFKMDLLSRTACAEAELRMNQIFKYTRDLYLQHKDSIPLPYGKALHEQTFVSFPAQWDATLREATIRAAQLAGFGNDVVGMDEPTAAMKFFLYHDLDRFKQLRHRGLIPSGEPVVALLIDMGAGTSDFVLFRATLDGTQRAELLSTWPPREEGGKKCQSLGGCEIDAILKRFIDRYVAENQRPEASLPESELEMITRHKEKAVSPLLARNEPVGGGEFDDLYFGLRQYGLKADASLYYIDREVFGREASEHICTFIELVDGALRDSLKHGKIKSIRDIDLVLLTGGHSKWYFVEELLCGNAVSGVRDDGFIRRGLANIRQLKTSIERERLLTQEEPQTTVAQGLVVPIDIEPVAANNFWYEIEVEIGSVPARMASARIPVVSRGDELPIEKKGLYRLEFQRTNAGPLTVAARIVPVVGSNIEDGERLHAYKPMEVTLEPASNAIGTKIHLDLYIEIIVSKEEQVAYIGYLGFDPIDPARNQDDIFWSRNVKSPDLERQERLAQCWVEARSRPRQIIKIS
jgi:hypothetical protein